MADSKVAALPELAEAPALADEFYVVDKSDTTDDATGSSKKVTKENLLEGTVKGVTGGTNVTVDNTDPENPIVSASAPASTPEGTAVLSTGEAIGKVLQADGDDSSSWVTLPGGGDALVANPLSQFAATTSAELAGVLSDETGTGSVVLATSPTLVAPDLGTPSALVATNATGTAAGLTVGATTGVEAGADVTNADNVAAAGALMDSEVTNLTQVKAFDTTNYATAAQGSKADSALQPTDIASGTITALTGALDLSAGSDGDVLTKQSDGSIALETPAGGGGGGGSGQTLYDVILDASGGGDYTDWSTAMSALTTGQTMFVRSGTYTETSGMTITADQLTIVGENMDTTLLQWNSTSHCNFSGADDLKFTNLTIENTNSGRMQFTGERPIIDGCRVLLTTGVGIFALQGSTSKNSTIINSHIETTMAATQRPISSWSIISNCTINIANNSNSSSYGVLDYIKMFNNNNVTVTSSGTDEAPVITTANNGTCMGNIINAGSATYALGVSLGDGTTCIGNVIGLAKYGIRAGNSCNIGSNNITTTVVSSSRGINISGSRNAIMGNFLQGHASATAIELSSTSDNNSVVGNVLYSWSLGVSTMGAGADDNVIMGNTTQTVTTTVSDSGTGTLYQTATDSDPLNT